MRHWRVDLQAARERRARSELQLTHLPSEPPHTGGCLCGEVRFEVTAPLVDAGYCRCRRCQRRTGAAASANALIVPGSLRVVRGEELVRDYEPLDGNIKCFCAHCGSALWTRRRGDRQIMRVRLGAFDRDPGVRPSYRKYVTHAGALGGDSRGWPTVFPGRRAGVAMHGGSRLRVEARRLDCSGKQRIAAAVSSTDLHRRLSVVRSDAEAQR